MRTTVRYKEGDLVQITRQGTYTLWRALRSHPPYLRECPVEDIEVQSHPPHQYKEIFENIEGKMGLVVYVRENRLEQPLGYRVLIEGHEVFCKSKVAEKYFRLVRAQGDESRRLSEVQNS